MPISEDQLRAWSAQGSIQQSADTYGRIKRALEADGTPYAKFKPTIYLQGSYANATNIRGESDVDIVIETNSVFYHGLEHLPQDQQTAFHSHYSTAEYQLSDFRRDVLAQLTSAFGDDVKNAPKAIKIKEGGGRRNADVLVAAEFRSYDFFSSAADFALTNDPGICFWASGSRIVNFPRQHSANLTTKHQATNSCFKPMIRTFKNLRSRLVEVGRIDSSTARNYFIEGLLYNVPNHIFELPFRDAFAGCFDYAANADRARFTCANEVYRLIGTDPNLTWSAEACNAFLNAIVEEWNAS